MDRANLKPIEFTNCITEGRIGKFRLSLADLKRIPDDRLRDFFGNFVIINVESGVSTRYYQRDSDNGMTYTAYSPLFDIHYDGYEIMHYSIILSVKTNREGRITSFDVTLGR